MLWIHIVLTGLIGAALGQSSEDGVSSNPMTLPPDLEKKLNDPDAEKLKTKISETFKKKCESNGHPEIFEAAQNSTAELMACLESLVDMKVLESEIQDAKPEGKVDEVFKKYCGKKLLFQQCFTNMTNKIKPCFNANEQKNLNTLHNITGQLGEFVCYKDGDRIALFIAEGGKECFQDNQEAVQKCFKDMFNVTNEDDAKQTALNITELPMLEFKKEQCQQMDSLEECIVSSLKNCRSDATGNIVESLFKYIRKATPCQKIAKDKTSKPNSSERAVTSAILITALAALLTI